MTILAGLASAGLVVIAAIHLLWALGFWWPIKDEASLARTVVGTRGITKMPGPIPCALVVVALLFAAAWPWFPPGILKTAGLFAIAVVFQVRAVAAYSTMMKRLAPEQPFRRLDETVYGPICIFFGLVFMLLSSQSTG
ncbi:DUF3995 domain-containing protein [Pseudooctadecabacter jejudonensis]|uniref:DUF3995 domain-containing protein n=1 Tax=Pseudooctadecabacter jejudonensis TaxID=1391910 RepID=A0A1Y5SH72_9RHOB|nr:DUF3995 domain-containing protein [Pseudooctadecabacter jejudonensis]SLN40628.1 hypothetical protein PSJ8397_02022 [Pseudooctadecabacter jejudonensis]